MGKDKSRFFSKGNDRKKNPVGSKRGAVHYKERDINTKRKRLPVNTEKYKTPPRKQDIDNLGTLQPDTKDAFSQLVETLNGKAVLDYANSSDSEDEPSNEIDDAKEQEDSATSDDSDENELADEDEFDQCSQDVSPEDPFEVHFQRDLSNGLYEAASSQPSVQEEHSLSWPVIGNMLFTRPNPKPDEAKKLATISLEKEFPSAEPGAVPALQKELNWNNFHIKSQLQDHIYHANNKHIETSVDLHTPLTPLQNELLSLITNYQDVYYPERTLDNSEEIRFVYCLHAINHALKTRLKVIHHNSRLVDKNNVPEEFRDQGLVRPKVLILVPFRDSALRIIKMIIAILLPGEKANVVNKKRFQDEFTGGEMAMPHKNVKPLDYERTFKGNIDDNFRIGISVTKKSLKLYADFYSSDIIVASPLGIRVIVGAEGEPERDYDFLASIELLILDQTEMFLMQNWDHLLHIFEHLHLQPRSAHGTDFSRIRTWALNGWTQYYRQTLLFASHPLPLITALYQRNCKNYAGKVSVFNSVMDGSICQVAVKVPQIFCRIECSSAVAAIDLRLKYFVDEILPQMNDPYMKHSLVYIPSYLDYVLIRNHFKKESISFVQISEYSKDGKVARARDKFFHGESRFLLYSERFHFYRRIKVKGIRHIVFYQPPTFPHFYSEMCNLIQDDGDANMSVTTLYSRYDVPQMSAILGSNRTSRLIKSRKIIQKLEAKD